MPADATPQKATDEEIAAIEADCQNERKAAFPTEYPTSCLLGCIDVADCLSQDDYREKVGGGGVYVHVSLCITRVPVS